MDRQAQKAREQRKALPFKEKLANFWYYHKTHLIIGVVFVALFIYTTNEFLNMTESDISIAYYSASPLSEEGISKLEAVLKTCVEDVNASGTIDIGIIAAYADPQREDEQTKATIMRLQAEFVAGQHSVYLVDEVYKKLIEENFGETIDSTLEITMLPEAKATFKDQEEKRLYWLTRRVYEQEMKDKDALARHQNAVSAENFLREKLGL